MKAARALKDIFLREGGWRRGVSDFGFKTSPGGRIAGGPQKRLSRAAWSQSRPVKSLRLTFRHELQSFVQERRELRSEGVAGADAEEPHLSFEPAVENAAPLELEKLIADGVDIDPQVPGDLPRKGLAVRAEEEEDPFLGRRFKKGFE